SSPAADATDLICLTVQAKLKRCGGEVRLFQLRVLGFGLLQDRDVGVGVFPEGGKILVGGSCLGGVALQGIGAAEVEVRQYTDGIPDHYPAVIQNFLKFPGSFSSLALN